MSKRSTVVKEPDFQTVANQYAKDSVEWMREHLADEEAREKISSEDGLEVLVRGDWHSPYSLNEDGSEHKEYIILLGTGGPASRIVGELDEFAQPETARFEYQDWFKPWTTAELSKADAATLLEYARQFWFGE